jgi:selenium-binding protein 1
MARNAMKSRKVPLRIALVCALAAAFPGSQPAAETCISPYVKALKQPEKVMYLWALPATPGQGEDFLAVIDVSLPSPTYGKIIKKIPVGSTGNEAHHIGYTDDRTKIWAASLNSDRLFIFDVSDQMNPKLIKTIDNVAGLTGLSGPHTPYAIPGRILVSMASGPDGTGAGGIAEFTNDGRFIASHKATNNPYETVIKPEYNRMITSTWFPQKTWMTPYDQWDPKTWSNPNTLLVWDLKERKIIQTLDSGGDAVMLAARWMLKPGAKYGYNISSGGNSIWMFKMEADGTFSYRKAGDTGPNCSPADLRQSPDDRYLYLSCFVGSEIQAWDISNPEQIKLHDTIQGVVQPNMMHVTYDGRRLYFTNSAISSIDYSSRYSMQLIQIGPDGRMKLDPNFKIDFAKAPEGPARPHDMLLN